MSSSREEILARVRSGLQRSSENSVRAKADIDRYVGEHPAGPRPPSPDDLVSRFCQRSSAHACSVERMAQISMLPAAVARYLAAHKLSPQAVCWPEFAELAWQEANLTVAARPTQPTDLVGITGCYCALAETGTLMLVSGRDTPAALSLLPETHIALVPAARIVADMEEAWRLVRTELGQLPRAVNFVSGPSRTGDIEQTIVLGAHGPYRVHILIVG